MISANVLLFDYVQGGRKLPHSKAPYGRIFKNYASLGETPARQKTGYLHLSTEALET